MDFNVVLWGHRLRAVGARPYKALAKSRLLPSFSVMSHRKAERAVDCGAFAFEGDIL